MYEVEIKAHVFDCEAVKNSLNSFADFLGVSEKKDVYWQQSIPGAVPVRLRIREESLKANETAKDKKTLQTLVTYKHKSQHLGRDGETYEVNDEHEFNISCRSAFENLLKDSGFLPLLAKHKLAMQWKTENILAELCAVDHLGYFLELEILLETNKPKDIDAAKKKLKTFLKKCSIPLAQIESKYYSELLKDKTEDRKTYV